MKLNFRPIVIAAILAEILGILSLVLLIVAFGPRDEGPAQAFAGTLGFYVGPITGFLFCLIGGYWVARRTQASFLANGLATGISAAALDVVIAVLLGAQFEWILIISNLGRMLAGALGGELAAKRSAPNVEDNV